MTDPKTEPAPPRFRAPPVWVVALFLALGVAAVAGAFFVPLRPRPTAPTPPDAVVQPPGFPDAPPFLLTERDGTAVDNSALDGKVWIAEFAFTRCRYCPQVSATMARLRKELNLTSSDSFRMVTFTIDPDRDTEAELRKYAETFTAADDRRWLFLRGPRSYVELLCRRGFKVGVRKVEGAEPGLEYEHFLDLLVIDKKGSVRGTFMGKPPDRDGAEGEFNASFTELKAKVGELLAE